MTATREPCPTCGGTRRVAYAEEGGTVWRCDVCGVVREEGL